jgi:hypothetical protein
MRQAQLEKFRPETHNRRGRAQKSDPKFSSAKGALMTEFQEDKDERFWRRLSIAVLAVLCVAAVVIYRMLD